MEGWTFKYSHFASADDEVTWGVISSSKVHN